MAHDVFISHSAKDKTVGDAVCATLEANGIRCWIAPRDVLPGADWGKSIVDAIAESRVMVLVFSANANASSHIKREVERAVNHAIPIIPLRIEDVMPEGALEYFLSTPHWLDAFAPPMERHLNHLTGVVAAIARGADSAAHPDGQSPILPLAVPAGLLSREVREAVTRAREAEAKALQAAYDARQAQSRARAIASQARAAAHRAESGNDDGYGVLTGSFEDDGTTWRYAGQIKDQDEHGFGVETRSNGVRLEGEFVDGKIHGYAVVVSADGTRSEGGFQNGEQSGVGVDSYSYGALYEGDFAGSERCGYGIYHYLATSKHFGAMPGQFEANQQTGYGVAYRTNGACWIGAFRDDAFDGYGAKLDPDGVVTEQGFYCRNKLVTTENGRS